MILRALSGKLGAWQVENLRILANWLEGLSLARDQFNLGEWHSETDCNTVACAVGWGLECPALQERGLFLMDECPYYRSKDGELELVHWDAVDHFYCETADGGDVGALGDEGRKALSAYLFMAVYYEDGGSREAVITRLREVVAMSEAMAG